MCPASLQTKRMGADIAEFNILHEILMDAILSLHAIFIYIDIICIAQG